MKLTIADLIRREGREPGGVMRWCDKGFKGTSLMFSASPAYKPGQLIYLSGAPSQTPRDRYHAKLAPVAYTIKHYFK